MRHKPSADVLTLTAPLPCRRTNNYGKHKTEKPDVATLLPPQAGEVSVIDAARELNWSYWRASDTFKRHGQRIPRRTSNSNHGWLYYIREADVVEYHKQKR